MKIRAIAFCSLLVGLTNASSFASTPAANHSLERKAEPYLEQSYAALRKRQISDVNYELQVDVDEKSTSFNGDISIDFVLTKHNKMPVTVDFDGGEVLAVELNGKPINWQHEKWFIRFAPELFAAGKNNLRIHYTHPFATAGDGLHRYKDQQTGNVYLYSNFEPYNAHKMFPHFDQPDIKATYKLDVNAPQEWQVISTTRELNIAPLGDKKHWKFAQTPVMASYVFSLHAGPYAVWEDKAGDIPLRLFARQELAQYVNFKEWFLFTQQAFAFYNQYFNYPYPFAKYDQLIVPDFNSGAMENIGGVTFNEAYVSRGQKTYLQRMRNNNVISHEMAHMWFGDLVTMGWWNGLWLNESFATYMATLQLANNSEFKADAWSVFFNESKLSAYNADHQLTTHAIELPVANTAEAFTNFDAITYGKGASVLKQLAIFVGEENFRLGVSAYLKKYAYKNTSLTNFMDEVAKSSNKNLTDWARTWLYQAGLNTIEVNFQCSGNGEQSVIKQLDIAQSATATYPYLRNQKTQLGLYVLRDEKLQPSNILPVIYKGARTRVRAAEGLECPAFIFPNLDDWAYLKMGIDKNSRDLAAKSINQFDSLTRKMLWEYLWDDAQGSKLPLNAYVKFVEQNIGSETDLRLAQTVISRLPVAAIYFWQMTNSGQDHKGDLLALEQFVQERIEVAPAGSDVQKVLFDIYVSLVHSPAGLARIEAYLANKNLPQGFVLDQDRRWSILRRLNQFLYGDYLSLTQAESLKDKSDLGQQSAISCEVIRPELGIKEKWFKEILAPDSTYKLATQRVVMRSLFPITQPQLRAAFEGRIEEQIPQLQARNNDRFLANYIDSLVASRKCTREATDAMAKIRDQYSNLGPVVQRSLSNAVQDEERCVNIKSLM